eukprot:GHUV01000465.1.p1 GENE.GHUV01000465.1~~GHUV01000465.1.p1  ORF type:complete len:426 (+),score=62.04 GHUV01000465.1:189-1280(+)
MTTQNHALRAMALVCAVWMLAPSANALIEGPGTYYGLELPEPFYNYWNYTSDVKDMHNANERNNFAAAADIYLKGKNNRRNETSMRIMHEFTYRNLSNEGPQSFWGIYSTHFQSTQYLKDLIDPALFGNGTFTRACCGVRSAALDVYFRLWLVAYAHHEVDGGVYRNAADEASHGFAVISSPVNEPSNYWNSVEKYSRAACVPPVRDPKTGKDYAATNIKKRDAFAAMGSAIATEDQDKRTAEIARVRAMLEREVLVQFMQVMMVEAKKATQVVGPNKSICYKQCSKGAPYQSGARAAWTSIQPLVARSTDKSTITQITNLLNRQISKPWDRKKFFPEFTVAVERLANSLGVNFRSEVWGCKW